MKLEGPILLGISLLLATIVTTWADLYKASSSVYQYGKKVENFQLTPAKSAGKYGVVYNYKIFFNPKSTRDRNIEFTVSGGDYYKVFMNTLESEWFYSATYPLGHSSKRDTLPYYNEVFSFSSWLDLYDNSISIKINTATLISNQNLFIAFKEITKNGDIRPVAIEVLRHEVYELIGKDKQLLESNLVQLLKGDSDCLNRNGLQEYLPTCPLDSYVIFPEANQKSLNVIDVVFLFYILLLICSVLLMRQTVPRKNYKNNN
jgi:hypothetical protein